MEEILHHLGCIKHCKWWDELPINWCRISSINSIFKKSWFPFFFRWWGCENSKATQNNFSVSWPRGPSMTFHYTYIVPVKATHAKSPQANPSINIFARQPPNNCVTYTNPRSPESFRFEGDRCWSCSFRVYSLPMWRILSFFHDVFNIFLGESMLFCVNP